MNKKTFSTILIGALLAGALVSCNKEGASNEEQNPMYNPATKEVTTNFVMSVTTGQSGTTKMSAENVQKNNNFLGIQDTKLIAYATGLATPYVNSTTAAGKKLYDLGILFNNGGLNAAQNKINSSNRILELAIPLQTDAMLFYGKAINENPGRAQGKMNSNISTTPSETYFDLVPRLSSAVAYNHTEALMAFALNEVMASEVDALPSGETYTSKGMNFSNLPAVSWKELGHQYEINNGLYGRTGTFAELSPLEEILGEAYSLITYIKTGEYRAGSSQSIKSTLSDLEKITNNVIGATPTGDAEANAQRLAEQLHARISYYFNSDDEFLSISTIKTRVVTTLGKMTESEWNSRFGQATNLNKFPYEDFGLPDGVAQLAFDRTNDTFSYVNPGASLFNNSLTMDPSRFMFPAELAYFVNSGLRVTDKADLTTADYPNGVNNWDDDTTSGNLWTAGNWQKNGKVLSTTRGVAIKDNVNYGVALLETNVAWGSGVSYLDDNRSAMTGGLESDRTFSVNDAHFTLKGVLINGQNPRMNWQYLKRGASGDPTGFDYVIYDDAIASSAVPTTAPNYTIVFDNYNEEAGENQNDVYVALEFENGGDDFWGKDNLVRKGGTFYLIAKLANSGHGSSISWPDKYQVPPIWGVDGEAVPSGKVAGESKRIPRVFIQNYLTKATFRIGATSLQKAVVTVPDLRTSQMSLGLSVDLEWLSGYEYDLTF